MPSKERCRLFPESYHIGVFGGTPRHRDLENLLGKRKRNAAAESEGVKIGSGIVRFRTQKSARMGVWGLEKGLAPLQVS